MRTGCTSSRTTSSTTLRSPRTFAAGHGSTFNGLVATTGYQPLWMLLLAGVLRSGAGSHGILLFLATAIWVSTLTSYVLSVRIMNKGGMPPWVASACSVFVAAYCLHLSTTCMEVTLAVPLTFAVLASVQQIQGWMAPGLRSISRAVLLGLLFWGHDAGAAGYRDLCLLLAVSLACQPELRAQVRIRWLAGFTAGLGPVIAYFILNRVVFGAWLPISGAAKQLRLHRGFSLRPWKSFLELTPTQWISLIIILVAIGALPGLWHRLCAADRVLA